MNMTKRHAEELRYGQAHGNDGEEWEYGGKLENKEGRRLKRSWYCLVLWHF